LYKYKPKKKSKSVPIKKDNTYEDLQKIDKFMDKIIESNKKERAYKKNNVKENIELKAKHSMRYQYDIVNDRDANEMI